MSIPHSGERVPPEVTWLSGLSEPVLMRDVDRFVDKLYQPALKFVSVPSIATEWHRYVVDLNRLPEDVDADSVEGSKNPSGTFTTGLHWVKTTKGEVLIEKPIPQMLHEKLVRDYYWPFHHQVEKKYAEFKGQGHEKIYQLDAHSMPSMGTSAHRDPGEVRAQVVVSDVDGQSCESRFKDLVIEAYKQAGFQVAYNWPYKGGRVTQVYGKPDLGQHAIQVELNRSLYMNEETKQLLSEPSKQVQQKIEKAVQFIFDGL
ncbi:MAG: N-formylglutamate amidohydrolase [Pseudobdellovibrionaceae bacterium]|nr:N-formylglutamate amidohydrolase [Bdellovibrionales bacterium]USN48917.1 MAG: N-formylglutamate amidohydrolase [Pseudobdellovibrionaceae bacterium]